MTNGLLPKAGNPVTPTSSIDHPAPLTRCGPKAFATGSGRRRHSEMKGAIFRIRRIDARYLVPAAARQRVLELYNWADILEKFDRLLVGDL